MKPTPYIDLDIRVTETELDQIDAKPFGVIRLDREGTVLSFNLYEQRLSRRRKEDVVGRNFFTEVAPCTKVQEFYGRFREGVTARALNATFGFVFKFPHGERHVDVSLFYKPTDDSIWVIVRGQQGSELLGA